MLNQAMLIEYLMHYLNVTFRELLQLLYFVSIFTNKERECGTVGFPTAPQKNEWPSRSCSIFEKKRCSISRSYLLEQGSGMPAQRAPLYSSLVISINVCKEKKLTMFKRLEQVFHEQCCYLCKLTQKLFIVYKIKL